MAFDNYLRFVHFLPMVKLHKAQVKLPKKAKIVDKTKE